MHGPNSRASVQANTAAVGYTAFATVRSVWWHDPKRMDADELCFERAATINYRGEHRQWELNSLGNRTTMVAVPRPRASKARSTRRGSPTGDTPAAARGECNELSNQFIVSGRNNSYPQQKSTMPSPVKWVAWRRSRYTVSATRRDEAVPPDPRPVRRPGDGNLNRFYSIMVIESYLICPIFLGPCTICTQTQMCPDTSGDNLANFDDVTNDALFGYHPDRLWREVVAWR